MVKTASLYDNFCKTDHLTDKNLMRFTTWRSSQIVQPRRTQHIAELVDELDDTLFTAVRHNDEHVLRYILPDRRTSSYRLRPKRHDLTLAIRRDSRNFFQRLLFKDMFEQLCAFLQLLFYLCVLYIIVISCVLPTV